jgi:lysophospholipase L1-like esterase
MDSLKQQQPTPQHGQPGAADEVDARTRRQPVFRRGVLPRVLTLCVLLLVACTPAARPPARSDVAARLGPDAPLLPLFQALAAQQAHTARQPLVILQIGDSHTANDSFSGRLRDLFQARFGDAGRGVLPPGIPYRWYRPARVSVTSRGWTVESSFHPATPGPFGISGLRQHAAHAAEMTLTAPLPGDMVQIAVEVLRQPGGGTIDAMLDSGGSTTIATRGPALQPVWVMIGGATATRALTLRADGDGPVDILAWRVTRGTPGVVYANLGTVGASVDIMDRWDPAIVREELARLQPAMIVLAFGTNEGFRDNTDLAAYAAGFAARLQALHEAAPGAALLVVGPPDGDRRRPGRSAAPAACGDPKWTHPPVLDDLRAVQRAAAAQHDAWFWDWYQAMGGACSMLRWAAATPPFAAPDHVHLFAPGYAATADILFRALMAGYAHYHAVLPAG